MNHIGSFRRVEDDEDEQHDGRLIHPHFLDATDEFHVQLKNARRRHVANVVQF